MPGVAWLGLGLAGSSYFAFGNLAGSLLGTVPAATHGENGLSVSKAVGEFCASLSVAYELAGTEIWARVVSGHIVVQSSGRGILTEEKYVWPTCLHSSPFSPYIIT